MTNNLLPPLLLGDNSARHGRSFVELMEMIDENIPSGWSAVDTAPPKNYKFKFNSVKVGQTTLLSYSLSPMQYKASSSPAPILSISFQGDFAYRQRARTIYERAGSIASLTAAHEVYDGASCNGVVGRGVAFSPDIERLALTLQIMSGRPGESNGIDARLEEARELNLQQPGFDIFKSFSQLIGLMNAIDCSPNTLRLLAVDDALYRHAALMLRPDLFLRDSVPASGSFRRLDDVCDYMRMHLDRQVTLTELESVSGLSARTLQYGFQKRFGCTPLQWLSNARLDQARRRLLNPDRETNVTRVALDAGFTNPGNFARKYFERFGELPSQTLSCKAL